MEFTDCGWVDLYTYTMTLRADAEGAGARYKTGTEVEAIETEDGSVTEVRVDGDTISSEHVVCATDWRTRNLLSDLVETPIRPFRWQTVNQEVGRAFGEEFPMAGINTPEGTGARSTTGTSTSAVARTPSRIPVTSAVQSPRISAKWSRRPS